MSDRGNLKSRFENYGAAPDAKAWAGISAAIPSKSKKKAVIWWFFAGSGVAAAVLISFLMINSGNSIENKFVADEEMIQKKDTELSGETASVEANIINSNITAKAIVIDSEVQLETRPQQKNTNIAKAPIVDVVGGRNKPLNQQNTNTAVLIQQAVTQKKDELSVIAVKAESKPAVIDLKIDFLEAKVTPYLASVRTHILPKKMQELSEKRGSWQWGGKLGSDFAANTLSTGQEASFETTSNTGVGTSIADSASFDIQYPTNQPILFTKINRPVSASLLLRFSPTPKLFIEIDPTITFVSAEIQKNTIPFTIYQLSSFGNKSIFLSTNVGINIGYKVLNTNRWAIDLAGGVNSERIPSTSLGQAPFFLIGSSVQAGINYQVSEKTSLRLAPEFSWVYGKSNQEFIQRFQNQNSFGVGFSILRDF